MTDIADALELGQPSVSKHLQVLRDVGLVYVRREGRRTMFRINAETLRTIHDWSGMFARYWRGQLRRIKAHADAINGAYQWLDLTPKGRDEDGLPSTMAWLRHHDKYDVRSAFGLVDSKPG